MRMKFVSTESHEKILNNNLRIINFLKNNPYVKRDNEILTLNGVAVLNNGCLCPIFLGKTFSFCPIMVKDGALHLMSHSLGPVLKAASLTIDIMIDKYNEDVLIGHNFTHPDLPVAKSAIDNPLSVIWYEKL